MTIRKDRLGRINPNRYNEKLEQQIVTLYLTGLTAKDVALKLGLKYNTSVRRVLIRYNIPLKSSGDILRKVHGNPLYENSYWLGVLATDGNIYKSRIKLAVQDKDKEWLQKYASITGANLLKEPKNCWAVSFKSPIVSEYLESKGITPNKSLTIKYKGVFNWDFVRGCIDGDGCMAKATPFSIKLFSASIIFINQVREFLLSEGIWCPEPKIVSGRTYGLSINRTEDVLVMYSKLYYKKEIDCLERKRSKIGSLIQEWISKQTAKSANILKNAELRGFKNL